MATLEKIRSKSVLLIIVIGVALLAFIVGDALTNSRNLFGEGNVVAKIGNEKIDIQEFQKKRGELSDQLEAARKQNPAQYANFDTQVLNQMAIEQLMDEKLIDAAVDKLGIKVGGDLLRYYMIESPVNQKMPELMQAIAQMGLQAQTPQQVYDIIFNPKKNGLTDADVAGLQRFWVSMEEETQRDVKRNIYKRLLYSTIQPNDLDKQAMYNDYIETKQLLFAALPYGNLDEKTYPVSQEELKAAYEQEKNRFRVNQPTKSVSFIAVNIGPSDADRAASQVLAEKVVKELRDSAAQLSKDSKKEGVSMIRKELRASDLPAGAIKDYVMRAPKDSVSIVSENIKGFTAIKMGRHTTAIDSIQLNIVQVVGGNLPDKVLAALNSGLAIDSLNTKFSKDSVTSQKEQWIPMFTAQGRSSALDQAQLDSLAKAGGRYIKLINQPQGAVLAKVVKQNAPVDVYEFEEITYTLKPSSRTVTEASNKLEKFLAENNTAEKFNKNAEKAGYSIQRTDVSQSTSAMPNQLAGGYYPDSRQVIRWVMIDGSEGEVSHIYESKDAVSPMLYAVAIDAEFDDFIPMTSQTVKDYLTDKVRRSKAGDALVKKYSTAGNTVEDIAKAMNVEPREIESFRFGMNPGMNDAPVIGKIAGSKPSQKAVVVKGRNGVYVYKINGEKTEKFAYNDDQYKQQYIRGLNPNLSLLLRGNKKIKNNAYKFEAGD